jgi:cysteinyl-tRNA synthetase
VFVLNITDVDDKIIAAAAQNSESPVELARRYEEAFWRDLDALNCLRPTIVTRVTEHVESAIIPYIERLVDQNMAYLVPGEGIYFDVRAFDNVMQRLNSRYGKLAPSVQAKDFVLENQRKKSTTGESKKDPRDFALWKFKKPDENFHWASSWGEGRPGWHIECSAMIESVSSALNVPFCVHAGGIDLQFPHHTNEIAQAEAYHMRGHWIEHWLHIGHLHIDGLKMSKSLKNFITIEHLLSDHPSSKISSPADDFRLWCLSTSSYRSPVTYSQERIEQAKQKRFELVRFLIDAEAWLRHSVTERKKWTADDVSLFQFVQTKNAQGRDSLLNDLGGALYVECMLDIAHEGSRYLSECSPERTPHEPLTVAVSTLRAMMSLVGFSDSTTKAGQHTTMNESSSIVGGESALLDELAQFRTTVRSLAMKSMKVDLNNVKQNLSALLQSCDDLRDRTLPSMGIALIDEKVEEEESKVGETVPKLWQFCVPTSNLPQEQNTPFQQPLSSDELKAIPLQDFFKAGQYAGQFADFDETGFPTKNKDGSDVSSRLRKKLSKKLEKHASRLRKI